MYVTHQFCPGHGSETVRERDGTRKWFRKQRRRSQNDHFAQAPAEVTVRSPCVMREVTQDFVRFISAENA